MKIYDEITKQEILSPDLSKGCVYDGVIVTGHTKEHYEVMEGTVTSDRPAGLRHFVPSRDITEPCQWYHIYTDEELEALQVEPAKLDSRLTALETRQADLQEALDLILSGATE